MGQTGRLRLIRDRFIAGHSNCDLRRHLDSVPPETPIRDVVDRYRVWENHADPAVRRVSKPSPDPMYPAYVVSDADNNIETTRVAAVTGQRSSPYQLEDSWSHGTLLYGTHFILLFFILLFHMSYNYVIIHFSHLPLCFFFYLITYFKLCMHRAFQPLPICLFNISIHITVLWRGLQIF